MTTLSHISLTPDKEVLITKKPYNYYLIITIIPALFLFFLILALIGRLDLLGALTCFLVFAGIVYVYFGRYLAKIKLYEGRIEVQYAFPWNPALVYTFDNLIELDHKGKPWQDIFWRSWSNVWYRNYQILYLKNQKGEVCQIRYNIYNEDDEILREQLNKKLIINRTSD